MDKGKVVVLRSLIFLTIILPRMGGVTAAEVRPKLHQVVYITATEICACSREICTRGDRLIAQIFVGDRRKLLKVIDLAKDAPAAEPYLDELNQGFQIPMVLFIDLRRRILWHTGGVFSKEAILKKLIEFGG